MFLTHYVTQLLSFIQIGKQKGKLEWDKCLLLPLIISYTAAELDPKGIWILLPEIPRIPYNPCYRTQDFVHNYRGNAGYLLDGDEFKEGAATAGASLRLALAISEERIWMEIRFMVIIKVEIQKMRVINKNRCVNILKDSRQNDVNAIY